MMRALALFLTTIPTMQHAQEAHLHLNPRWEYVADTVMGGVSRGQARRETVQGREAVRLTGTVSLDNNGGFVQIAFDVDKAGGRDIRDWTGLQLEVLGNSENYDLRVRTDQLTRPWQSFRADFFAPNSWTTVRIPFDELTPYRTEARFDPARLRRIGVVAVGRVMQADIAVAGISFYRQ